MEFKKGRSNEFHGSRLTNRREKLRVSGNPWDLREKVLKKVTWGDDVKGLKH